MISKFSGTCAACQQPYEAGDAIWYVRGRATVCMTCHDAGAENPPSTHASGPRTNDPGPAGPSGQAAMSGEVLNELRAMRGLLMDILDELRHPNRPTEPPEPF